MGGSQGCTDGRNGSRLREPNVSQSSHVESSSVASESTYFKLISTGPLPRQTHTTHSATTHELGGTLDLALPHPSQDPNEQTKSYRLHSLLPPANFALSTVSLPPSQLAFLGLRLLVILQVLVH